MVQNLVLAIESFETYFNTEGSLNVHDKAELLMGLTTINPMVLEYLIKILNCSLTITDYHETTPPTSPKKNKPPIPDSDLEFIEKTFKIPRAWVVDKYNKGEIIKREKCNNSSHCRHNPCAFSHIIYYENSLIDESEIWSGFSWNYKCNYRRQFDSEF